MKFNAYFHEKGFAPEKQPVMCDFNVVQNDQNPNRFYISLLLEMEDDRNSGNVLAFALATLTEFEFQPNDVPKALPEDESERWQLFYNALSAAIGIARGYLVNYLAPTIYRGYILPLLDIEALVNRKYARPRLPAVPSTAPSEKPTPRAKKGE
ncbi:MAG: hypothetical protein JWP58_4499 [Hymenobacter sp.]|nr:hypothetical protein [Hymenobacter sp.]